MMIGKRDFLTNSLPGLNSSAVKTQGEILGSRADRRRKTELATRTSELPNQLLLEVERERGKRGDRIFFEVRKEKGTVFHHSLQTSRKR